MRTDVQDGVEENEPYGMICSHSNTATNNTRGALSSTWVLSTINTIIDDSIVNSDQVDQQRQSETKQYEPYVRTSSSRVGQDRILVLYPVVWCTVSLLIVLILLMVLIELFV